MRTIRLRYIFLAVTLLMCGLMTGCDDEQEAPFISYIRITNPESADSLLVAAGQGQMIAIMGRNLQDTREVYFNDLKAVVNLTFVTSSSIIVRVPSELPRVVTNELTLVFADGSSLRYDFTVDVAKPLVSRMKCEYVAEGETATFYGNYFYPPLVVTFAGGVEGEIVGRSDEHLDVRVPAGALAGPVTVASNFGETVTDFWFRDDRNIFISFDSSYANGTWKSYDYIVSSDPDIENISGDFVRINRNLGAWPFLEVFGGPAEGDIGLEVGSIPAGAVVNPSAYSLKFEVNTLSSLTGASMRLHIGNADNGGLDAARQSSYYTWEANVSTSGQWETVTIPWIDVYKGFSEDTRYSLFIYFHGPNALLHNFGIDNFRVVPNEGD